MTAQKRIRKTNKQLQAAIFKAAIQILNTDGYPKVTFANIAKLAGTTRPVLYRRWENPFMLLYEAEQYFSDDIKSLAELDFSDATMRDNLIRTISHFHSSPRFMHAYMVELGNETPSAQKLEKKLKKENLFIMERLLSQAQLNGEIKHTVTDYVKLLPFNLLLYQVMIDQAEVTDAWVNQMIDEVALPAIMAQQKELHH